MALYLRKVIHPQAHENYRVILKPDDGDEIELGSIGLEHGGVWTWAIDTVIPMRTHLTQGEGADRKDCMRQFRAALGPLCRRHREPCRVPGGEAGSMNVHRKTLFVTVTEINQVTEKVTK